MSMRIKYSIPVFVFVAIFHPAVHAATIIEFDWNDGTTQDWFDSNDPPVNENGKLRFGSEGNGSTQVFGPLWIPGQDWSGLDQVSFEMEINSYSGISSPGEMTIAEFWIMSVHDFYGPDFAVASLNWELDISGWSFNETRQFNLSILDVAQFIPSAYAATVSDLLGDVTFVEIRLRGADFNTQLSSGLLDNFIASTAVPIPAGLWLMGSGLAGLYAFAFKKRSAVAHSNQPAPHS